MIYSHLNITIIYHSLSFSHSGVNHAWTLQGSEPQLIESQNSLNLLVLQIKKLVFVMKS